ncbi:hypothetical protein N7489_009963 [Penicillium chrysogenum]|uniref:uncharacterized protein n=1 Tax=Penicillium chrysogenum TaxID=5076 RepID=UPI0024DF20DF|nr:uncharacterized protein N7489_009963 [Penicillium chrysogenum]KAJ5229255.1 hypothetical protein N7489_009963 [Penicillium chrysogenum]
MASHSEMGDAPDQNDIGDVDSLASTVESDPEAEYLVNDIHAERRFYVEPDSEDDEGVFITQYLVEWTGCLGKKKKQIVEGKLKPSFNLKSWEKKMAQLEKTTKKRKEARRRKREQRARQKSLPQAESSRLANSDTIDAHEPEAGVASDRAPSPPSVDSTIQALFVPAETPPPSKAVARQWLQQIAPPTSDTSSAQTPGNEPPGSTTMVPQAETTLDKPNSRLAKRLNTKHKPPARPKSPPQAAKPALSSFGTGPGTKRAYRENKWSERAPDLSQMELMKPSEFPPRTNIGATTSVVGPSVTSPKSPKAANQPASENSVSLTCPLKAGQTNGKATTQPQKPAVLAPSSVMAPPESRSSKLSPTVSISSSATQPKPLPQTNLTQPVDSVDPTVSTFSPRGEALLTNPGRSTSAFTAPSSAPRAPLQDNIDSPTGPSASPRTVSPPAVLSGARAKATSKKPAGLSDSPTVLSPAIPTRARAIPNLERPTENRGSRDSRETVRGHDTYRLESAYSTVRADTYRPSDLSRQPSPSRWSPPPRRSSPLRRSPPPEGRAHHLLVGHRHLDGHHHLAGYLHPDVHHHLVGHRHPDGHHHLGGRRPSDDHHPPESHDHRPPVDRQGPLAVIWEINSVRSTGWVEGFSDTNENLFHLAEDLRKDDLIAIHYPTEQRKGPQVVWLAWSRGSQEFKFPHPDDEVPPGVPLLVAARSMLAPIIALAASGPSQPSERPHSLLPDASLSLRVEPPSTSDGLGSGSPARRSNFHHDTRMSGSLQSRETLAPAPAQTLLPANQLKDNSICTNPQPQGNLASQAAQAATQALDEYMKAHKISVEELATIEEGGKLSKAHMFYLHFPRGNEEVGTDLELLQALLKYYDKIIFTSDSPEGWAKFVHSSRQGVAIFHESFAGYDTLQPPLNSVLPTNSFNFWIVRIQRPLELVDPRYCSPGDHGLRIFPYGGVILLTEDMLTDLKGVAVTLQWIRNINKYKRRSWTLMLPPGILEWIERRLSDKKYSQDHGLLLLIHMLIIKNNATDAHTGLFDKASLHLNSKSNVIAPSLNEYGTRTEHHDLKIQDKVERDADHLVEFFAGWSLINIPRFRNFIAVTSLGASTGQRWDKWGHMTAMRGGFAHFFKRFKIDSAGLMGYLSGGTKLQSSTSQITTPVTATTPQTPNWASYNSNASVQSTFTGSPNGKGTNKYPAPYK